LTEVLTRRLSVTILAGLALVFVPAGGAHAKVPRGLFGVVYGFRDTVPQQDLNRMKGRVGAVRWSMGWPRIEPQPGVFRFHTVADPVIGALASRGIPTLPTFMSSPPWATGSNQRNTPPIHGNATAAWADFLRRAVQRYGPGGKYWAPDPSLGSQPGSPCPGAVNLSPYRCVWGANAVPRPVHTWQVWSEVNLPGAWPPRPKPKQYARLVRISHNAIDGVDPHAKVALAGMPGFVPYRGWKYLNRLYNANGIKKYFDLAAFHPYGPTVQNVASQLKRVRKVMRRHHDKHTGLWLSETGWGSASFPGELNAGKHGQARLLKKSFHLFKKQRKRWHLKRVTWFDWRDPDTYTGTCSFCPYAGLFEKSGKPKPSWGAYKRATGTTVPR
jgi:hypothetical protein